MRCVIKKRGARCFFSCQELGVSYQSECLIASTERVMRCDDGGMRIALFYKNDLRTFVRWNQSCGDEWAEQRRIQLWPYMYYISII
jgi:hypothetical protein